MIVLWTNLKSGDAEKNQVFFFFFFKRKRWTTENGSQEGGNGKESKMITGLYHQMDDDTNCWEGKVWNQNRLGKQGSVLSFILKILFKTPAR